MRKTFIRLAPPKRKGQNDPYEGVTVTGLTKLSRATIYRLIQHGNFPRPYLVSGRSLWSEGEISSWIEACKKGVRTNWVTKGEKE